MGRLRKTDEVLPMRVSRDNRNGALRYKRPDCQRHVYFGGAPEPLALQLADAMNAAFGARPARGARHLWRGQFQSYRWADAPPELLALANARLPDIMPKGRPVRAEHDRHGWAYEMPKRAALRHGLKPLTERDTAISPAKRAWVKALYDAAKKNATARKIAFELSPDDLAAMVAESRGRCAVSGIALSVDRGELATGRRMRRPWAPSLDRIDSAKGYSRENCRIVCCAANYAMSQWGEEILVELAKSIARKRISRRAAQE